VVIRRSFLAGAVLLPAIRPALSAPAAQEQARIEQLIRFVESQKDMVFIRNGTEYTSEDAGKFLRGKLEAMGSDVKTAREFIDRIATKSSMSGEPYRVKFADGKTMLASHFLGAELKRLERPPGTY
jgi:hypothetical protein